MNEGETPRRRGAPPSVPHDVGQSLPTIPELTLRHEIARGGMGVVYRGRQDFLDRDVAVKLLSSHLQGEEFAARFRREAKILAGIKHPNIVACHMAGTTSTGQSYLVMEFVDGPSLKTWIAEHGALELPAALRLVRQLASALSHAAELGVIHRDVKPDNILLEAPTSTSLDLAFPYVPKLVDLGLARMGHEIGDLGLTAPGSVMGTPVTMAPEQFDAPDSVDFRADIYGLGCVLYQMLTGVPAFESTKLTEIVVEKRRPNGPDPSDRSAGIPAAVGQLVVTMLACDPAARPASYQELIGRVDELLASAQRGSPPADQGDAEPGTRGGPNLLQTAEFQFLAASGALAGDGPATFPDPTAVNARMERDRDRGVESAPSVPATPAEPGSTRDAAGSAATSSVPTRPQRRRRGRRIALGAVGILLLLVAVPWLKRHRNRRAAVPPPTHDTAADRSTGGVAIRGLDGVVRPDVPIELRAEAADPDGGELHYRWTVQPDANASLVSPAAASTVLRLDGLPGDEFTIGLEATAGSSDPIQVTQSVVLAYEPVDLFADFSVKDTRWFSRARQRGEWTRRAEDGAVECAAKDFAGFRSCGIRGSIWRVAGQLLPERENRRAYAQTAVCLRFGGTRQLALLCEREGRAGEQWTVSLTEMHRADGRAGLAFRPLAQGSKVVAVVDKRGRLSGATYSITRRGNEITLSFGFPGIGELAEHRERVRSNANVTLSLVARGGRSVYPKLELW